MCGITARISNSFSSLICSFKAILPPLFPSSLDSIIHQSNCFSFLAQFFIFLFPVPSFSYTFISSSPSIFIPSLYFYIFFTLHHFIILSFLSVSLCSCMLEKPWIAVSKALWQQSTKKSNQPQSMSHLSPFLFFFFLNLHLLFSSLVASPSLYLLLHLFSLLYPLLRFTSPLLSSLLYPLLLFPSPYLFSPFLSQFSLFFYSLHPTCFLPSYFSSHSSSQQLYAHITFSNIYLIPFIFIFNPHLYFILYYMLVCTYVRTYVYTYVCQQGIFYFMCLTYLFIY